MKKLCVVFPGRRYSCDRSLLYYPSRMIEMEGFEMKYLHYDVHKERRDMIELDKNIEEAYLFTLNEFKDFDFSQYGEIIFVSKSIGTVVASKLKKIKKLTNVYQILITPLDLTLPYIESQDLIISSDADHYLIDAKNKLQKYKNVYIFKDLPHSLESKTDINISLEANNKVVSLVSDYLKTISRQEKNNF